MGLAASGSSDGDGFGGWLGRLGSVAVSGVLDPEVGHLAFDDAREDLAVAEVSASYNGGPWQYVVQLLEFRDNKVVRERIYVMEGWEGSRVAGSQALGHSRRPAGVKPCGCPRRPESGRGGFPDLLGLAIPAVPVSDGCQGALPVSPERTSLYYYGSRSS
jgi:hypothetical protein